MLGNEVRQEGDTYGKGIAYSVFLKFCSTLNLLKSNIAKICCDYRRCKRECIEIDKYRGGLIESHRVREILQEGGIDQALNKSEWVELIEAFELDDGEGVAYRLMLKAFSQVILSAPYSRYNYNS